jgi:hypothetical protein
LPNTKKNKLRVKLPKLTIRKRLLLRRRARMGHQLSDSVREPGSCLSISNTLRSSVVRMTKSLKRSLISSKIENFNQSLERLLNYKTKPRIQSVRKVPET